MRIYATTTFNWHSKNIENWGGTENLDFCSGYKAFLKPTKDVFRVQGAWQSSNTLSTMVHGQVSHIIIIWHTPPPSPQTFTSTQLKILDLPLLIIFQMKLLVYGV